MKNVKRRPKEFWTGPIAPPAGAPMVMTDAGNGVGWGVLRRHLGDQHNDLREFIWFKLSFGRGDAGYLDGWSAEATHQVLLPPDGPADLLSAKRLAERYEAEAFNGIKDLACVAKILIDKRDRILVEWPRITAFAYQEFCLKRSMACVAILHVPSKSGVRRPAHVHLIAPARELDGDGFGAFLRPFASDAGGPEIARAWQVWS